MNPVNTSALESVTGVPVLKVISYRAFVVNRILLFEVMNCVEGQAHGLPEGTGLDSTPTLLQTGK